MRRYAPVIVTLALVAASAAAFTVTERLKLERSPITAPRFDRQFSPVCDCPTAVARLRLLFREAETVDATVVDSQGNAVRTLASGEAVPAGRHTFLWDGRDDDGELVPDGVYRLRLRLEREGRTIAVPTTIRVDTTPPRVVLLAVRPSAFVPGSSGRRSYVKVVFRSSERGQQELIVDGEVASTSPVRARGRSSLNWRGTLDGQQVEPGSYELAVRVRDRAGNESRPAGPASVTVEPAAS